MEEEQLILPIYMCPFCLHQGNITEYITYTPKGNESKMFECPDCHNTMRKATLTTEQSIEQYATWVFAYATSGFWKKIKFEQFKARLKALGMAQQFWTKYKELKSEKGKEDYDSGYDKYKESQDYDT